MLLTFIVWLVGCCLYAYYWISDLPRWDYPGIWILPLSGFLVYRFPFLLIGFVVLLILELLLIPQTQKAGQDVV